MGASRINAAEKLGRPNGRGTGEGQLRREGEWGRGRSRPIPSTRRAGIPEPTLHAIGLGDVVVALIRSIIVLMTRSQPAYSIESVQRRQATDSFRSSAVRSSRPLVTCPGCNGSLGLYVRADGLHCCSDDNNCVRSVHLDEMRRVPIHGIRRGATIGYRPVGPRTSRPRVGAQECVGERASTSHRRSHRISCSAGTFSR